MTLRSSLATLTMLLAMIGFTPRASAWDVMINGRPASDLDSGASVAVDPVTGCIFVTGNRQMTTTSSSFFVAKYLPDGRRQWVQEVDGGSGVAIAVDVNGFVIAAGSTSGSTTKSDVLLVKIDGRRARKNVLWTRSFDIGQSNDQLRDMALTPDGGVVIVGTANDLRTFFLMKFGSDGQDAWPTPRLIAGTMTSGFSLGNAVAILPDGDIAATGVVSNNTTNGDMFVGRFDSVSGTPRWQFTINGSPRNGEDSGAALAAAPNGDIVVAGTAAIATLGLNSSFTVLRFDGFGSLRWSKAIEGGFSAAANTASTVAIAPGGDVIAAGRLSATTTGSIFFVLATDPDGNERWRYANAGASPFLGARSVAFDTDGNPIVTGVVAHPGAITAFGLLALEKANGGVLWNAPILGSLPLVHGGADVVAVPATNSVIAVGTTQNERTTSDITVAQVTDGQEDWRALITGPGKRIDRADNVLAMAVRLRQDAIALAGASEKVGTIEGDVREFRVVKVRNNGKVAWKFDLADPMPHLNNAALAVAFGTGGEIYAAGRTCALATSCFTVVRVSRQGDEVWRATIPGTISGRGEARALVVDDADHTVIVAGVTPSAAGSALAVYKLDAETGAIRWSYLSDVVGAANAMTMTGPGTVAIAAQLLGRFAVLELDTQTGAPITSVDLGVGVAQSVVYDDVRDHLVAGGILVAGDLAFPTVTKLDRDGTRIWTFGAPTGSLGVATARLAVNRLDGAIGLIATGVDAQTRRGLFTATLLSTDGQALFNASARGAANAVEFAGTTMIVAAQLDADQQVGPFDSTFAVLAFAENGTEVWRRTAHGDVAAGTNSASSVAVDNERGTIFAAGVVANAETRADMFAVGLSDDGSELPGNQTTAPE